MSKHLLIDAGNTRIKMAWLMPALPESRGATHTLGHTEFASAFADWVQLAQPEPGFQVWVSNVAGETFMQSLSTTLAPWQAVLHLIRPCVLFDQLHNDYAQPEQLGTDRWLGLLGVLARARQTHGSTLPPVLLAHFGTATTLDAVVAQRFIGGLILPGYRLMLTALNQGTASLPLAHGTVQAFPRTTHDAIVSGIAAAQAGAVLRQCLQLKQTYQHDPLVFVAGGAWPDIADELRTQLVHAGSTLPLQVVDNPVLDGLARVATLSPYFSS